MIYGHARRSEVASSREIQWLLRGGMVLWLLENNSQLPTTRAMNTGRQHYGLVGLHLYRVRAKAGFRVSAFNYIARVTVSWQAEFLGCVYRLRSEYEGS